MDDMDLTSFLDQTIQNLKMMRDKVAKVDEENARLANLVEVKTQRISAYESQIDNMKLELREANKLIDDYKHDNHKLKKRMREASDDENKIKKRLKLESRVEFPNKPDYDRKPKYEKYDKDYPSSSRDYKPKSSKIDIIEIEEALKRNLIVPCRHYERGGTCPVGKDCMFFHDGERTKGWLRASNLLRDAKDRERDR